MKYVREGRFGKAKQFKTGAIVGTYPKPLLCFMFDEGGLYVIPKKGTPPPKDGIPLDCSEEDIITIKPPEFPEWVKRKDQPKVLAVDFYSYRVGALTDDYKPVASLTGLHEFYIALNILLKECPWKTVLADPITGLSETVHSHIAAANPKKLEDARKWAPDIGYQLCKTVAQLATLQAHTVCIMHETEQTNETGAVISIGPMIPSKYAKERIAGLFHQVLYAEISNGKPIVRTKNYGYVRGLGCRWPANLPEVCGADFKSIYGKELQ